MEIVLLLRPNSDQPNEYKSKHKYIQIIMENKTLFENFADMQKQAAESFSQAAENMQKAMFNTNSVDFNSDFFKKWYDSQMAWFNQVQGEKQNPHTMEFFNNWMSQQMNMAKNWQEMAEKMFHSMPAMNNMSNEFGNMMNMFNSWRTTMNNTYSEMMKNFKEGTPKDAFSGLYNNGEVYMKWFELMMPVMKSLNDKTFTPELFKQMFNAPVYKDMMDKMFNLQPENMKSWMNTMNTNMKDEMGRMMDMGKTAFDSMKSNMDHQMKSMMPVDFFNNMINNYTNWFNQMNAAVAPLSHIMPQNDMTRDMDAMKEIGNMLAVYQMKNSQLQYMMYQAGMKAMDGLSESLYTKMRNGEEMKSAMAVYQEWLNHQDKHLVTLFETDEYSKLMGEVSALQLNMKKRMEKVMEKSLAPLPLINRTEMDELYKTIHELKKRVNMLEKQIDNEVVAEEAKPAKKAAKNA